MLVISQDLEELFEISDRLSVIYDGKLSPSLNTKSISLKQLGLMMGGGSGFSEKDAIENVS